MIGDKLRECRRSEKMTLSQLSKATGFSSSYISAVELGRINPSLMALYKLSSSLGVDVGTLFEGYARETSSCQVVRKNERITVVYPKSEFKYELLTRELKSDKPEFLQLKLPSCSCSSPQPLVHGGYEYALVTKGRFNISVGEETYLLEEGDSIYFPSSIPHLVENTEKVEAEAIWVLVPPQQ